MASPIPILLSILVLCSPAASDNPPILRPNLYSSVNFETPARDSCVTSSTSNVSTTAPDCRCISTSSNVSAASAPINTAIDRYITSTASSISAAHAPIISVLDCCVTSTASVSAASAPISSSPDQCVAVNISATSSPITSPPDRCVTSTASNISAASAPISSIPDRCVTSSPSNDPSTSASVRTAFGFAVGYGIGLDYFELTNPDMYGDGTLDLQGFLTGFLSQGLDPCDWLMKAPDVFCKLTVHRILGECVLFDGKGTCNSSGTTWSGYCGGLAFWILLIWGVKCLNVQVGNKLLGIALVCGLVMSLNATNDCTGVVFEFEYCREYCNNDPISPSLDCCNKLSVVASVNEKNTSASCTCYIAEENNELEFKCDTTKLVLLYKFCEIPVIWFPHMCQNVVLPPLQLMIAPPAPPKKKSLLARLSGYFKVVVYIVGSLLTLSVGGLAIWYLIRSLVLKCPGDQAVGIKLADLAIATGKLCSNSAP